MAAASRRWSDVNNNATYNAIDMEKGRFSLNFSKVLRYVNLTRLAWKCVRIVRIMLYTYLRYIRTIYLTNIYVEQPSLCRRPLMLCDFHA